MSKSGNKQTEAAITGQSGKAADPESKKVRRIRARSSYLLFQQLYNFLKTNPNTEDILKKLYEILDAKGGFGSKNNAEYAAESLGWVLEDNG